MKAKMIVTASVLVLALSVKAQVEMPLYQGAIPGAIAVPDQE
jgi:hypothetical protein